MADFATQVIAGASGGFLRAFKTGAMLDAEERRAERREESQIKLLMKQSEQQQIQAERKAVRNEAFMTLQLGERLKTQREISAATIKSNQDTRKIIVQGQLDIMKGRVESAEGIAAEERKFKREKLGVTEKLGERKLEIAEKELAVEEAGEPSPEAAVAYGQASLALAGGNFEEAQRLTLEGDKTANPKQRETHNKNLLRAKEINDRAPTAKARLVQEGIETYLSLDINDTTKAIFKEKARKKADNKSFDFVKRFIQDSLSAGYDLNDIRKYIDEHGWDVSIDILED